MVGTTTKLDGSNKNSYFHLRKVLKNKNIENHYQNKIWESDSNKCLSCSACTVYCPTCNCFDIRDNLAITKNSELKPKNRTKTDCKRNKINHKTITKSMKQNRRRNRPRPLFQISKQKCRKKD